MAIAVRDFRAPPANASNSNLTLSENVVNYVGGKVYVVDGLSVWGGWEGLGLASEIWEGCGGE